MTEPLTMPVKWLLVALGSVIGSSVAMAFVPPLHWRDGAAKWLACCAFTACVSPALLHAVVRTIGVTPAAIPDVSLALSCILGLCSQWLINALIDLSRTRSSSLVNDGLSAMFPWIKKKDQP